MNAIHNTYFTSLNRAGIRLLLLILTATTSLQIQAQRTICRGDTVELNAQNYDGQEIQWQRSTGGGNYEDIPNGDQKLIKVVPEVLTAYRLKITTEECDVQFSNVRRVAFPCRGQDEIEYNGKTYRLTETDCDCWFADNLATETYRNGDNIPRVPSNAAWRNTEEGAQIELDAQPVNADVYGLLYNAYAVLDNRNLCPTGWHVADRVDWDNLAEYAGGRNVAGGKMKIQGIDLWKGPNVGADNELEFNAVPGGLRNFNGGFFFERENTQWWVYRSGSNLMPYESIAHYSADLDRHNADKEMGFYVRCVKD